MPSRREGGASGCLPFQADEPRPFAQVIEEAPRHAIPGKVGRIGGQRERAKGRIGDDPRGKGVPDADSFFNLPAGGTEDGDED